MRLPFYRLKNGKLGTPVIIRFVAQDGELEVAAKQIAMAAILGEQRNWQQEIEERGYEEVAAADEQTMLDVVKGLTKSQVMVEVRTSFTMYGYGEWAPLDGLPDAVEEAANARVRELFPGAYDV